MSKKPQIKQASIKDLFYTYQEIGTPKRIGNKISIGVDFSSQKTALSLILKNFGGPLNLSELIELFNADKNHPCYGLLGDISVSSLRNWSSSGLVPLKDCGKFAQFLEVTPELLNYEEVSGFKVFSDSWIHTVENAYCLTDEDKKLILKMKPYPNNSGK